MCDLARKLHNRTKVLLQNCSHEGKEKIHLDRKKKQKQKKSEVNKFGSNVKRGGNIGSH